jgi:hypothetical protein
MDGMFLLSGSKQTCFTVAGPLSDGLVAFSCPQGVSEPVLQLKVLLLMALWHFPALRE